VQTERIKTVNVHGLAGDHRVMAEASTDILVDEDIFFIEYSDTHVSNCCVKICNVLH